MKVTVEIVRCTNHPNNYALAIAGRRIAGYKCCGTWSTFVVWKLDAKGLRFDLKQAFADATQRAREERLR